MSRPAKWALAAVLILGITAGLMASPAPPQAARDASPGALLSGLQTPGGLAAPLQLMLVFSLLALVPALLLSMTCFTRVLVVMHFLRQALGTQNMPNNQILLGLSLFLTLFIMSPTAEVVWQQAISPALDGKIGYDVALEQASVPLRTFMARYTRETDLALFINIAKLPRPANIADVPMRVLVPAFMISELKTAFQIGFVLFLPFLIIDIIISSILLSVGMFQLPPVIISTPIKILLFVMVDGWNLVVGALVKSFF